MNMNKTYIYNRLVNKFISDEYFDEVEKFVNFIKRHLNYMNGDKLRSLCSRHKCINIIFHDELTIIYST